MSGLGFVKIYEASTVFEAELIRRSLSVRGIRCLIPGADLNPGTLGKEHENAIFVPESERDQALEVLKQVWSFFEQPPEPDRET